MFFSFFSTTLFCLFGNAVIQVAEGIYIHKLSNNVIKFLYFSSIKLFILQSATTTTIIIIIVIMNMVYSSLMKINGNKSYRRLRSPSNSIKYCMFPISICIGMEDKGGEVK
ncbi:hypothetical protein PIB30_055111 [Stylosanthes scabra]|uniref:Uncharacterized protein n=1 Tax=Stylosanthes scabra TaxID=79078 RepID=A0ABU6UI04_9FABA|nr:hypothetical protein [Stylosanthes scabra]